MTLYMVILHEISLLSFMSCIDINHITYLIYIFTAKEETSVPIFMSYALIIQTTYVIYIILLHWVA